jgi:hypothetical protein
MKKFETAIRYAGGDAIFYHSSADAGNLEKVLSGQTHIVVQPLSSEKLTPEFKKLMTALKRRDLSLVPEQNIGIAIVKDSCEVDCNPLRKTTLRSSAPLLETQSHALLLASPSQSLAVVNTQELGVSDTPRRIPETLTGSRKSATSCSSQKVRDL